MKNTLAFLPFIFCCFLLSCVPEPSDPPINNLTDNSKTDAEKLIGNTWKTTTIFDHEAGNNLFDHIDDAEMLVLTFSENGTIEARGESKVLTGTYTTNNATIQTISINLSRPADFAPQPREAAFFDYLDAANEFYIDDEILVIEETNKHSANFVAL